MRHPKLRIVGFFLLVGALLAVTAHNSNVDAQQPQPPPTSTSVCDPDFPPTEISVRATGAAYRVAPSRRGEAFRTGQPADIMLSGFGFNNSGGPLMFNHPTAIATDGIRLLVSDRSNNRVLIWPVLPGSGADAPTIALGQPDLVSNNPGTGRGQMNWPNDVAITLDGKVVVADSYNDRLLIWNSVPTRSGQPADVVVRNSELQWPWGVWTDGHRLAASSTVGHKSKVLFWTSFPSVEDGRPSYESTGGGHFGTPRHITSDGSRFFAVGDHNARGSTPEVATHVWLSYPTGDSAPNFTMRSPVARPAGRFLDERSSSLAGAFTLRGELVMVGRWLHIWDGIPTSADAPPRLTLDDFPFTEGGVATAGDRIFVVLINGNRVVVYRTVPSSERDPDFALGSPDLCTNTLATRYLMTSPVAATNGRSLFASSGFDGTLYVWRDVPDESGAVPDFVYSLPVAPTANALHGDALVLAGARTVLLWRALPTQGQLPSVTYRDRIGSAQFTQLTGVALDGRYFMLADQSGVIWIWDGVPTENQNPIATLNVDGLSTIQSDGAYLVVTRTNASAIQVYRLANVGDGMQPYVVLQNPPQNVAASYRINLPQHAIAGDNHLFVADTGNNRVLVWTNIDAARTQGPDLVLGAETLNEVTPEIGQNKLFWPGWLAYDGAYLWVGEYKFSGRLVRFPRQANPSTLR